ncbi:MAG: DNA replication/repair protein RecF [Chitinophagaceae bacterium]
MLSLQHISLVQFKNYDNRSFGFPGRITAICGLNGAGKTNLLDAIHYLCFTRSYFSRLDAGHVKHGHSGFRIEGNFSIGTNQEKAVCVLRETGRKEFSLNDSLYEKFSSHIGRYPCVVIAPDDAELITGGSEERRKFLDALLAQLDDAYLRNLITYTRLLQQRNSLLRSFSETGSYDEGLLEVIDEQMIEPAGYIFQTRQEFMTSFIPIAQRLYATIAGKEEDISIFFVSELSNSSTAAIFRANRQKDRFAQRTTSGIHRDDIHIQLDKQPFRNIASQGQRKSLLFSLKLAETEILHREKGFAPILLLDDVFEKLDEDRISNLLYKVCVENPGQVFITDTHEERLCSHLDALSLDFGIIRLQD